MFTKQTETESMLDAEIARALVKLKDLDSDAKEYGELLERIAKLHKLKTEEQSEKISPNNALLVAANVFGILSIIHHERIGVITSKAMGFIIKPTK
jgi:hypothetical protein